MDARVQAAIPGFSKPYFQAGLAGYSDRAMRVLARRHGAPYCVTEAWTDTILNAGGKGLARARLEPPGAPREDHPIAGQIIGTDPEPMARAALHLVEFGHDVIDVNLACPCKKSGPRIPRGGNLLALPERAIAILRAVRECVPMHVPTTVKLRRAFDDGPKYTAMFERIFDACYELGYLFTTVHARTTEQRYDGPSDWTFLRDLRRRHPDRVVFGSGDVFEARDVARMLDETGVSGVSVARGAIANPWIFREIDAVLSGTVIEKPTLTEQGAVLRAHDALAHECQKPAVAGRMMRKFGIHFARHHPRAEDVRRAFIATRTSEQWHAVLDAFYEDPPLFN
ncbi:MAG: tRNA-dihydrouridine synthase family protein [Planctomycetes bacterium]|nr:tRNA-dihydrouridine synthase family protein [Planctomycetota bacterium]